MKRAAMALMVLLAACSDGPDVLTPKDRIVGDSIPEPLTDTPGDAVRGQTVFTEREQGHCVLCHQVSSLDAPFQGDVGPDLSDVGTRFSPQPGNYDAALPSDERPAAGRTGICRQTCTERRRDRGSCCLS